jgi:RHS repeat-associated protein
MRYPGQYFDAEAGLHYNYFRDYEPGTGRYIESDPIGLDGGLSTYMYAGGSPIMVDDPLGLFAPAAGCAVNPACATGFVSVCQAVASAIVGAAGMSVGAPQCTGGPSQCDPDCEKLYEQIKRLRDELKKRYADMRNDKYDMYATAFSGQSMTWASHQRQFEATQRALRRKLKEAEERGCFAYADDAWTWATRSNPVQPAP